MTPIYISAQQLHKCFIRDLKIISLLIIISVVTRYFLPTLIGDTIFWGGLIFVIFQKNDQLYLSIVFIVFLLSTPGYLFPNTDPSTIYSLPRVNLSGFSREIKYDEVFTFILITKFLINHSKKYLFYRFQITIVIIYSVILLFFGFFMGLSLFGFLKTVRYVIPILLFLIVPVFVKPQHIYQLINLFFFLSVIFVIFQLIDIISGYPLASRFGENTFLMFGEVVDKNSKVLNSADSAALRFVYGPMILLISLIASLALYDDKNKVFSKKFLVFIILITSFSIFFSATRGWTAAVLIILLGMITINFKFFSYFIFGIILIAILIVSSERLSNQMTNTIERLLTVEKFVKGDTYAGGDRFTERGPRVFNKFAERPFFGFGFSDEYYKYEDGHVGNQTLLLNGGILGFIIYFQFISFIFYMIISKLNKHNQTILVPFVLGLIGILIIHSVTAMMFSFSYFAYSALLLSIFFYLIHFFIFDYSFLLIDQDRQKQ